VHLLESGRPSFPRRTFLTVTTSSRPDTTHASWYSRWQRIEFTSAQLFIGAILIAAGLSAISLVFNHSIDYDPEGWIVYARELFGPQALNTSGFPAWKPLPVFLIGPFTLLTRGEADVYYWLFITRAASVLTVFAVASLANRFGGRWAALLAGFMVVVSPWWGVDGAIGRDSSVSALFVLCAFLAHYKGWYRWVVVALVAAALMRPEATPLLLVYGVWMWRTHRLAWWWAPVGIAVIVLSWEIPSMLHAGLNPAQISKNTGGQNSPTHAKFPAGTVVLNAGRQAQPIPAILLVIAGIAAVYGLVVHRNDRFARLWGRSREELSILFIGIAWVLIVAAETQDGYAGNPRYLIPAVALFFVAGSVVAVRLAGSSRWALAMSLLVCAIATAAYSTHSLHSGVRLIQQRDAQISTIRHELAVVKCGPGTHVETNHENNAFLAQMTGEPLQDTINWNLPTVLFNGGSYYWFDYCSP